MTLTQNIAANIVAFGLGCIAFGRLVGIIKVRFPDEQQRLNNREAQEGITVDMPMIPFLPSGQRRKIISDEWGESPVRKACAAWWWTRWMQRRRYG